MYRHNELKSTKQQTSKSQIMHFYVQNSLIGIISFPAQLIDSHQLKYIPLLLKICV